MTMSPVGRELQMSTPRAIPAPGDPRGGCGVRAAGGIIRAAMLTLRPATPADVPLVLSMIRELAVYEREPDAVVATEDALLRDGFGPRPLFEVTLAEWSGEPAGFAFWFLTYSTWRGQPTLYLEDLFVRPEARGRGIGKAFMQHLARVAVERGCGRFAWQVLDWNAPSLAFYASLGANVHREWLTCRLEGPALAALAASRKP
jgi:GNAT superfamily N-acetyltransferase